MLPEALPYHLRVRDHFRQQTSTWEFFTTALTREEQLSDAEQQARTQLYTLGKGELEIAARIVTAITDREASEPSYLETARLFNLYTRIYGDRCAGEVTDDPVHPEYPLRVRALQLWQEKREAADPEISRMIEGPRELGRLDIFSQAMIRERTKEFIFEFLRPAWIRTPPVTALAYAYFSDLRWDARDVQDNADTIGEAGARDETDAEDNADAGEPGAGNRGEEVDRSFSHGPRARLREGLGGAHGSIRDYFAFVMLDLVLADPALEERLANRARAFAAGLNLTDSFGHLYNRKSN
jgi:hypothetical protein